VTEPLEQRLSDIGAHLVVPEGASLPERVRGRIEEAPRRRLVALRRPRRVALLAAAILMVAAGAAIAGIAIRGVLITVDPTATASPRAGARLSLGEPVTLKRARARAGFPILVPAALGPPDEVWIDERLAATPVTLVYHPRPRLPRSTVSGAALLLTQMRAELDEAVLAKTVGSPQDIEQVTVAGRPGFWIRGEHLVSYLARDGTSFQDTLRLAAGTLLWDREGTTFRIETAVSLKRALEIAGSL